MLSGAEVKHQGDHDDSGTDTDDEGRQIQQAAAVAKHRPAEPPRVYAHPKPAKPPPARPAVRGKAAPKRPAGAITVKTLVDAGFLVPGCKVLYVEYKGVITWADLTEDGAIVCSGKVYESPSAFSIAIKRKVNPDRKADDGWKAVKYAGKLLEHFKEQYLRQQLAGGGFLGPRGTTPTGSLTGRSPYSSAHPSPLRHGAEEGGGVDGPPSKRQRMDGDLVVNGEGLALGGRPGLKIKLKVKGGQPEPSPSPTGPLLPLRAPPLLPTMECGAYRGEPGSGEPGAQPFRLEVSDMVHIVVDFHAHCSAAEVGGLLAGSWEAGSRTLRVTRAFPVLEAQPATAAAERGAAAVEFEAADLARVKEVIKNWGLLCVGSYRSHPAYAAAPNVLDVRQQRAAQEEARTEDGDEPCVCAVVSPYDPAMPDPTCSPMTWFHVQYDRDQPLPPLPSPASPPASPSSAPPLPAPPGCRPMRLELSDGDSTNTSMDIMNLVSTQFQHTARTYAVRPARAPLSLAWRPICLAPGGHPPPATYLDKLVSSITARLPDMFEGDLRVTYGTMVRDMVQHEFNIVDRLGVERARAAARGSEDGSGGGFGGRPRRAAREGVAALTARLGGNGDETEEETEEEELKLDDAEEDDD